MHELALCQALLRQVEAVAAEHNASSVSRILLRYGPLSGVEPHLLRQAYPLAAAGTPAEGAELVMEESPVRVRCRTCGVESEAVPNRLVCAACGDWHTDLVSGDELLLASLELDIPEDPAPE
ncbi:hydrogenase maturation nickel metallochaperone HypA [Thioalbus denitrificans]|uniref:Hydrogenase maturation factor HypA n=1 Tax=Thioalbus denitrificans TaxID=547122 RepID=A0A369C3V1_9GAMM|nr:hydrogenase maturation nickel metallochaperone HypA [Thioalbus denitrificans]RCX26554.1 hydrogenase nickel incorporation protein HypA/HybF [Thioalbus denitrificans]